MEVWDRAAESCMRRIREMRREHCDFKMHVNVLDFMQISTLLAYIYEP